MRQRKSPRALAAVVAAMTTALLIAGCADGGGSGETGADKTLVIGISTPDSGPLALYGNSAGTTMAYLKAINDAGGIEGYTFDFVTIDNQGTVAGGGSAIQDLISQDVFIIESITTPPFNGSVNVIQRQSSDIPILAIASGAAIKQAGLPNVFGVLTDYTEESYYMLDHIITQAGHKKVALLYDSNANEAGTLDVDYAASLGGELVVAIAVPADATNMTPYVQQIEQAGADAVLTMTSATLAGYFLKSAGSLGLDIPIFGFSGDLDPSLIDIAGSAAEGFTLSKAYPPVDAQTPEMDKFRTTTAQYAPNMDTYFGTMGWNIGAMIAAAVESVATSGQEMTGANFQQALFGLDGQLVGFTTLTIKPDAHYALIGKDGLEMYMVKDGKFVPADL
jgi:ABC-type branched-subunit amino acid transport system substrate-binding protein